METKDIQQIKESLDKAKISKKKEEKILEDVKERMEKERTMNVSIKEGAAASVMSGFTDSYVTPYALALNANNAQIGFLSSIPSLISPLSQIFGSRLMEKYSRKRIIAVSVALNALMWLPILALSLFFWKNIFPSNLPVILIIFYSLYAVFGAVAGPAWFSLLGDVVPEKIRGRYFGKRNKICGAIALIAAVTAAFILDFFKTKGLVLIGFSVLFLVACIARVISAYLFKKHYEPKFKLEKGYYFSFFQFMKKAPSNNFGKFVIYVSLMSLAVNIAGPFFTVYMLKDLGFSYTTFMLINISASIFSLLFMPIWGKFSDKYGNRELLRIGGFLVPLLPIAWLFSSSPLYLAVVPQLISGVAWSAFNLASGNFIYDSVTPQRRGICVAYFNLLNGIGVFVGASLGGLLAQYLNISFMNIFLFIFLISGIARLLVTILLLPRIKEVRKVSEPRANPLLYIKEMKPVTSIAHGIINDLRGIKGIAKKGFLKI
jgi:MFS family permease